MGLYTCLYEVLTPSKLLKKGFIYNEEECCEFFAEKRYIKNFKHLQVKVEFTQDDLEAFMRIEDLCYKDLIFTMNDRLNYEVIGLFVGRVSRLNKGTNSQFYKNNMLYSDIIVSKKILEEVSELYFKDSKFKEEIVDKFIEGKMFVSFQ